MSLNCNRAAALSQTNSIFKIQGSRYTSLFDTQPILNMRIDDEIKTSNFEDVYHKVIINLAFTNGWIQNKFRVHLDSYGITQQQFNVLRILRGQYPKPATINLIKDRMIDKMSDASRITDRLVQKELVTRTVNEKDRRAVDIQISESGLSLLDRLDSEVRIGNMVKDHLDEGDAALLSDLLDRFRNGAEQKKS